MPNSLDHSQLCHLGLTVIETEIQELMALKSRLDERFAFACDLLLACQGKIITIGVGKSGHIARKIAATLASTGSPAFFIHPTEASHGDLGMITKQDVVLALSNSGETHEIISLLPSIKRLGIPFITLTGKPNSTIAKAANINLDASVSIEACPLDLAPTSSTTVALVIGDALAVALLQARGFTTTDFVSSHPGGVLGKRLLLRVSDVMHTKQAIPKVTKNTSISDALVEITQKRLGMTTIVNAKDQLLGVFTDGDLRRILKRQLDFHNTTINEVMTINCKTIQQEVLAAEALQKMETLKITSFPVINDQQQVVGVLHIHDLLSAGIG